MLARLAAAGSITVPCLRQFATRQRPGARQELLTDAFHTRVRARGNPAGIHSPLPVLEVSAGLGCEWHKASLECLAGA